MALPDRLDTPRLLLRRWRPDDRESFAAIWEDPAVRRSLWPVPEVERPAASTVLDHHVGHWSRHGFGLWAIESNDDVAGWVGPSHPVFIPSLAHEVELGWALRRVYWGRGLATEAAAAALSVTLEYLAPPRVVSLVATGNLRSRRLAQRLAMRVAGQVEHPMLGIALDVHERAGPAVSGGA